MNSLKDFTIKALATGFGFGCSPTIPGTTGTLPGVAIAWFLFPIGWGFAVVLTLVALAGGVWLATKAEAFYGHDGRPIVIDEISCMMLSYLFVPHIWQYYLVGFILFRLLDIWKPYPARKWESLPSGWGIVADDFVIGVYTNVVLQLLALFRVWQ